MQWIECEISVYTLSDLALRIDHYTIGIINKNPVEP